MLKMFMMMMMMTTVDAPMFGWRQSPQKS